MVFSEKVPANGSADGIAVNHNSASGMRRALLSSFALATCALMLSSATLANDYPVVADKSLAKLLGAGGRLSRKLHPFDDRQHAVWKLSSETEPVSIPAEIQCVIKDSTAADNAQMPYLVYMPEKDRVLIILERDQPVRTALIHSDDHGVTWSKPRWLHVDASDKPDVFVLGLTYLGAGKLMAYSEDVSNGHWRSADFGENWSFVEPAKIKSARYVWDPLLVLRASDGRVNKLVESGYRPTEVAFGSADGPCSQGFSRFSGDEGQTWSDELKVPQWLGVNEITIIPARNGDWVAACRTDYPPRFAMPIVGTQSPEVRSGALDHYSGLGVCVSKDEGQTWSKLNRLYEWGRHHPSMVFLPDGKIVMTYVVRLGYPYTADGLSQFGVEAVVSSDDGQTWDLEHRYVLATWVGNIQGANAWYCGVQSTSTLLLPDGKLLTAFGTGFRNPVETTVCKMDVALVRWQLSP